MRFKEVFYKHANSVSDMKPKNTNLLFVSQEFWDNQGTEVSSIALQL